MLDSALHNGKIIVFGVGNFYRSDDAVGLIVLEKLRSQNLRGVLLIEIVGDGLSLIQEWTERDKVIIIDAVSSGSSPGTIFRFDLLKQQIPNKKFHFSSHTFNIISAIELAVQLKKLPAELTLFAIEGKSFGFGSRVSHEVFEASEIVTDDVVTLCREYLSTYNL
ncbi:MAG: hydrogenase maturation protease [Ignavibacteriaceae bacterium]